jgi:hypothetical protein
MDAQNVGNGAIAWMRTTTHTVVSDLHVLRRLEIWTIVHTCTKQAHECMTCGGAEEAQHEDGEMLLRRVLQVPVQYGAACSRVCIYPCAFMAVRAFRIYIYIYIYIYIHIHTYIQTCVHMLRDDRSCRHVCIRVPCSTKIHTPVHCLLAFIHTYVPNLPSYIHTYPTCLHAHIRTQLVCMHTYVPNLPACTHTYPTCLHAHTYVLNLSA